MLLLLWWRKRRGNGERRTFSPLPPLSFHISLSKTIVNYIFSEFIFQKQMLWTKWPLQLQILKSTKRIYTVLFSSFSVVQKPVQSVSNKGEEEEGTRWGRRRKEEGRGWGQEERRRGRDKGGVMPFEAVPCPPRRCETSVPSCSQFYQVSFPIM